MLNKFLLQFCVFVSVSFRYICNGLSWNHKVYVFNPFLSCVRQLLTLWFSCCSTWPTSDFVAGDMFVPCKSHCYMSHGPNTSKIKSGSVDRTHADPVGQGATTHAEYYNLLCVLLWLDFILLIEGNVLNLCCEILKYEGRTESHEQQFFVK